MKQILYSIMMCCLMVTFLTACSQENDPFPQGEGTKGNSITLKLSTGIQFQTRAEAAGAEVAVSHLDVFIFDANETMQHYERVSNCTDQQGTVTLAASKDDSMRIPDIMSTCWRIVHILKPSLKILPT